MGRRRTSGEEVLVGLLIAAAVAIAVLGVYLVAIAAVAILGWLARLVVRHTSAPASPPRLVQATAPAPVAPPPESQFHVAHPVDPSVFDDSTLAETAAVQVFASWASKLPKAPRNAGDAVRSMELRTRLIGRLVTRIEGRRAVWRSAPYAGRDKVGAPALDCAAIDPWNPPVDLRRLSRHAASCANCQGQGRVACVGCGGAGRVECWSCSGAGKYCGTTANGANRLLNCKQCRGKGDLACSDCRQGRVECPTCHGTKKLECWIEIDASVREDVQVEPDGQVTRAYVWGSDGVHASRQELERDAAIVCEVARDRALAAEDLPAQLPPDWMAAHGPSLQPDFRPHDRIVSQSFTLLEVPSIELTYCVGDDVQAIELHGRRMLAPPISTDRLFRRRAGSLNRLAVILAALPAGAAILYLARGSYFHSLPALGVFAAAVGLALCVYRAVWNASIGRLAARRWLKMSFLPLVAAAGLAIAAEPSARATRDYLDAGQLDLARAELEALDPHGQRVHFWADLGLRETRAETDVERAKRRAAAIPAGTPQAAEARAHLDRLLLRSASAALADKQISAASDRLAQLSQAAQASSEARATQAEVALAHGARCLAQRTWSCAFASAKQAADLGLTERSQALRESALTALRTAADQALVEAEAKGPLAARVAAQKRAIDTWSELTAVEPGPEPSRLAATRDAHARDVARLDKQEAALRKKQEAEERRAAAAQARAEKKRLAREAREQRRREAAERRAARASGSLMCNDGTESPTCTCGGSWRGCCSHHGGVAGCE
jgi:hypothetical protein